MAEALEEQDLERPDIQRLAWDCSPPASSVSNPAISRMARCLGSQLGSAAALQIEHDHFSGATHDAAELCRAQYQ